ncbi:hypothetical protein [Deinococcus aquiradiocola]|uniref:RelA/SpoT domain-containing protein n=1 Tax=Deinococcus aquiradiocola TaxID=393059 RepID=A0A917UUR1_9DEIO|nr:hypothetical protein [Deinococcus aquiradiocola]GGJ86877.1 hypothetical protein GCM10008939_33570 [Deinococcus aquiradiocola]
MTDHTADDRASLNRARRAGLTDRQARISLDLTRATPHHLAPGQHQKNLVLAYWQARTDADTYYAQVRAFADAHGLTSRTRPGTVKDANRSVEKMKNAPDRVPVDLLAATLTATSVDQMYDAAVLVPNAFHVVGFRDRMIERANSGYGDLQFTVDLGAHLAELKIVHAQFDHIDRYEHRVYEISRGILAAASDELDVPEEIVVLALNAASRQMYTEIWQAILDAENGGPQ